MKKPKTIVKIMISGYYGFNNTGDEAILTSMVRAFKENHYNYMFNQDGLLDIF
ncbi:unnamed protein product [marine sediment metagenome]|uniref:Polysaccharide pyruvyl transferase domain-containing protein n=1 Tax=marine sediment metagenome TaxID=412755 RepID=X1VLV3_9ZZZZ